MTAFSAAINAIFTDRNMAADATYQPISGDPLTVRVMRRSPDEVRTFGETRLHSQTTVLDVRSSEIASPQKGDRFSIGSETFEIQSPPERDSEQLVWTCDVRPAT